MSQETNDSSSDRFTVEQSMLVGISGLLLAVLGIGGLIFLVGEAVYRSYGPAPMFFVCVGIGAGLITLSKWMMANR